LTAAVPSLANCYVILWSCFNFLILALLLAIPIVCIVLLLKMNRRMEKIEAEMQKMLKDDQI
jgi:Flp pilus assembly protein TadB